MVSLARPEPRATTLVAADGYPLGGSVFEPRRPRGTVIVHGATAVPHTYYAAFAGFLAARGLRVLTYDYRGIGASRPARLRGFDATMTEWALLDARAAHAWARAQGDDVVIVGHSFGGQLLGLLDDARDARGALLVASQFGWYRHWPRREQLKLAFFFRAAVPVLTTALGYLPGRAGLGEDLPAGVAREWARWCTHPEYLAGYHADAGARFTRWDRATMLLSFTDDDFAPAAAVEALARRLAQAPLERVEIAPAEAGLPSLGHFGFFRSRAASRLWGDAARFLDAALSDSTDAARRQPPPPAPSVTLAELERDLAYGRD